MNFNNAFGFPQRPNNNCGCHQVPNNNCNCNFCSNIPLNSLLGNVLGADF